MAKTELPACLILVRKRRPPFGPCWPREDLVLIDENGQPMRHIYRFAILYKASNPTSIVRVWRLHPGKPRYQRKVKLIKDDFVLLDIRVIEPKKFAAFQLDLESLANK